MKQLKVGKPRIATNTAMPVTPVLNELANKASIAMKSSTIINKYNQIKGDDRIMRFLNDPVMDLRRGDCYPLSK
jgi:hypothetical protein